MAVSSGTPSSSQPAATGAPALPACSGRRAAPARRHRSPRAWREHQADRHRCPRPVTAQHIAARHRHVQIGASSAATASTTSPSAALAADQRDELAAGTPPAASIARRTLRPSTRAWRPGAARPRPPGRALPAAAVGRRACDAHSRATSGGAGSARKLRVPSSWCSTNGVSTRAERASLSRSARVETPFVLHHEDGSRSFLAEPAPPAALARLCARTPAGLEPLTAALAPEVWGDLRRSAKRAVLGRNVRRLIDATGGVPRGELVTLVGGCAADGEVLDAIAAELAPLDVPWRAASARPSRAARGGRGRTRARARAGERSRVIALLADPGAGSAVAPRRRRLRGRRRAARDGHRRGRAAGARRARRRAARRWGSASAWTPGAAASRWPPRRGAPTSKAPPTARSGGRRAASRPAARSERVAR